MQDMTFPQPNQEVLLTRQKHEAQKMGLHYDTRIVVGDKAYSWASKKLTPEPGKSIILFEQPVHDREYALSKTVVIPDGQYGAGVTHLEYARKAKLSEHSTPEQFTVVTTDDGTRLLFRKLPKDNRWGDKAWLHKNLGTKNKYLDKVASIIKRSDQLVTSQISGDDWKKLSNDPVLKKKVLNSGAFYGTVSSSPGDGIKNSNNNDFINFGQPIFQVFH